jgi:hypothetical protein
MNHEREMAAIEELMRLQSLPSPHQLRSNPVNLLELLRNVS